jgi:hypothetical protein
VGGGDQHMVKLIIQVPAFNELVEDMLVRVRELELRVVPDADDVQLASGHSEIVRLSSGGPEVVRLAPPSGSRVEGGYGPR